MRNSNNTTPAQDAIETVSGDSTNPIITVLCGTTPYSVAWGDLTLNNQVALATRAISHIMKNETSAGASRALDVELEIADQSDAARKVARKAYRDESDANMAHWYELLNVEGASKWEMITTGQMSATERVRVSEFERELLKLVDDCIKADWAGKKGPDGKAIVIPRNNTDVMTFSNGQTRTREQLRAVVLNRVSKPGKPGGDELREQAAQIVAMRKVATPDPQPEVAPVESPDEMGY